MRSFAVLLTLAFYGFLACRHEAGAIAQDADSSKVAASRSDWTQWGGSNARMNTPVGLNIPAQWNAGELQGSHRKKGQQPVGSKNVKWAVKLGSETYGNPVVASGKVFVGTNNGAGYLGRYSPDVDLGVLLCFEEATGNFLWQHSNEKLSTGRVHDWPNQGVCSTPVIERDRLWYVSNRGEIVCLDTEGFYDGQDDGLEQKQWTDLFRVEALCQIHASNHLRSDKLPAVIREGLSRLGQSLPPYVAVSASKDQASWTVAESTFNGRVRSVKEPQLRIQISDKRVSVFGALADNPRSLTKELFTVSEQLFANLGNENVVWSLRNELKLRGIQLSNDPQLATLKEGVQWSFVGVVDGVQQPFRLQLSGWELVIQNLVPWKEDADVVWRFDMMRELGVSQHNMATCSMLAVDGVLFACTSNGVDESHVNIPAPDAPSFIAIDRETGRVLWTDNSPGGNILHAQWASPSYGVFNGQPQVIFPGGDGWLYSFDPKGNGNGGSRLLWKFDGNPKSSLYGGGTYMPGRSATRCHFIGFPAIHDGLVYIANGEDPEHGEGSGHLWCIDPTKRLDGGDVSAELAVDQQENILAPRRFQAIDLKLGERAIPNPNSAVVWHYTGRDPKEFEGTFHRSLSTPVIQDDILYIADFSGLLHCLHAKTGQAFWTFDCFAAVWSSPTLVDGKVYMCDEDGEVNIFRHASKPKTTHFPSVNSDAGIERTHQKLIQEGVMINVCKFPNAIYTTPIVANNVLYIATRNALYAIEESDE